MVDAIGWTAGGTHPLLHPSRVSDYSALARNMHMATLESLENDVMCSHLKKRTRTVHLLLYEIATGVVRHCISVCNMGNPLTTNTICATVRFIITGLSSRKAVASSLKAQ